MVEYGVFYAETQVTLGWRNTKKLGSAQGHIMFSQVINGTFQSSKIQVEFLILVISVRVQDHY